MAHEFGIRTTLAERTAEFIRQKILTLSSGFQPGTRLYPGKLAEELDVSVTPIREALKLLAAEGLVEFSPRRGTSVCHYSAAELRDLVAVLAGLETLALRLGGGKFTREELAEFRQRLDLCKRAVNRKDVADYRVNDDEFHHLLVAGSRSPRLIGLYETMQKQAMIIEVQNSRYPEGMREALAEHRALLVQLERGDLARSEELLALHWQQQRARLCRTYGEFARVDSSQFETNAKKVAVKVSRAGRSG
jgi:DNA-binding GntR family transcriptional regulator